MALTGAFSASPIATSDEYARAATIRVLAAAAVALALAVGYAIAIIATNGAAVLLAPIVGIFVVIAVVHRPVIGAYLTIGSAILFEQYEINGVYPLTAQVHFFQNLSAFTPIPIRLSLSDLLMLLTLASMLVRQALGTRPPLRMGPFGGAVKGFAAMCVFAIVIGLLRGPGWDIDAALQEMRGASQMLLAYFLAVNLIRTRWQVNAVAWVLVLFVGVKGVQAILNWQSAQSVGIDLDAVTGHEDVIFFDVAFAILAVMLVTGVRSRLTIALLLITPVLVTAELLTERRVAFVALGTVLAAVGLLSLASNPRRGLVFAAVTALSLGAYLAVFWDDSGPLGQPARAVRGVIEPSSLSGRDTLSNHWRDIENRNIAFTVQQLPVTGVGIGQQYLFREEPPPLGPPKFFYWKNFTHNAALWPWLKAGIFGAFALWFLVARVILLGSAMYARLRDVDLRWVAAVPVAIVIVWITYAGVEPAFTNSRTLIALGVLLAFTAPLAHAARAVTEAS